MACKSTKYTGRTVVLEYALGCGDEQPEPGDWKNFGALRTKEFNLEWETTDATADDSIGALRENLATFQSLTISGDGVCKASGAGAANLIELTKHVANPQGTAGQPVVWLRMTFPDITFTAFMILTTMSRSAPFDDVVTYSMEASATSSDFGLIVEDTPEPVTITSVTVSPSTLSMSVNDLDALTATVVPGTSPEVKWTSSDELVATVDNHGHVEAVGTGTATITATSVYDNTKSDTCEVEVS